MYQEICMKNIHPGVFGLKERLDVLMVNRGLADSREKAKALIMSGSVFVKEQREYKAGTSFDVNVPIEVKGQQLKYVSRGGLKLEKAFEIWKLPVDGAVCMDVGSSTGGFTDCMLQNGAAKVYAVDVGTNQLAWKLRQDERVVSMEKTNIRYVTQDDIGEKVDFVSIDVAFISLKKVLEPVCGIMKDGACIVCLIKPQFEAGREKVGKKGVVRDSATHVEVINGILDYIEELPFCVLGIDYSPVRGPEGNIEYLLYMQKTGGAAENASGTGICGEDIRDMVERANSQL